MIARTILKLLLSPFAYLYGLVIYYRNKRFDQRISDIYFSPVPVISIGNISAGGTGKTPVAEYVLRYVTKQNKRCAYLSRGYGRKTKGYRQVLIGEGGANDYGDEALQIAYKFPDLPVAVCEKRREGITRLLKSFSPDVIVLDDAFQHRQVGRKLDIVVIDANHLPQDDALLPSGRLREPISGLNRAHFFVINKLKSHDQMADIMPKFHSWDKPLAFTSPFHEKLFHFWDVNDQIFWPCLDYDVILFAGLGNNMFFARQIKEVGIQVKHQAFFADHYTYKEKDMKELVHVFEELSTLPATKDLRIITSEKDYYRLKDQSWLINYRSYPFYYLPMVLKWWEGEPKLRSILNKVIEHDGTLQ